jgi:hypothetical protein
MRYLFLLFISILLGACQQNEDYAVYILTRNSQSKQGDLVLKFNQFKSEISHIGLALENDRNSKVYHISYDKANDKGSSLLVEDFKTFWNSPNSYHNTLWKMNISKSEYLKIKNRIKQLESELLFFDLDSTTENGYYCSEFIYKILTISDAKYQIEKTKAKLEGLERLIAGQEELHYYPADFFLNYKKFGLQQVN